MACKRRRFRSREAVWARNYDLHVIGGDANRWTCHYCGMPADTVDHIPPLSRYHDAMNEWPDTVAIRIPSCRECNSLGSDWLDVTFLARAERIKDRLAERYESELAMPMWTEGELAEVGPCLRRSIRMALGTKLLVRARLAYLPMERQDGVKRGLLALEALCSSVGLLDAV